MKLRLMVTGFLPSGLACSYVTIAALGFPFLPVMVMVVLLTGICEDYRRSRNKWGEC